MEVYYIIVNKDIHYKATFYDLLSSDNKYISFVEREKSSSLNKITLNFPLKMNETDPTETINRFNKLILLQG
jgi:hypothetical protein